jgi:hypothetical protein
MLHQSHFAGGTYLYTLPLLKLIERGLSQEFTSIYESLRDLLLTKHFLDTYCYKHVEDMQQHLDT